MAERVVLGANIPSKFAAYEDTIFTAAANGIVVTRDGGAESFFWQPSSGNYPIENVTVSLGGTLCFNERRLDVSLHVYDALTLQRIQEIEDVGKVALQSVAFDESAQQLFVFTTMPECAVQVFTKALSGSFSFSRSVPISDRFSGCTLSPTLSGFLLCGQKALFGFAPDTDNRFVESFDLTSTIGEANVTAVAAGIDSCVTYATTGGSVYRHHLSGGGGVPKVVYHSDETDDPIASLYSVEGGKSVFVARESGALVQVALRDAGQGEIVMETDLPFPARSFAPVGSSATAYFIGTDYGVYKLDIEGQSIVDTVVTPVRCCLGGTIVKCLAANGGTHSIAVCADGSFLVTDLVSDVKYFYRAFTQQSAKDVVLDVCLANGNLVIVHGDDHRTTLHDPLTGCLIATLPYGNEDSKPTKCVSNAAGFLIVFDERCVFFFSPTTDAAMNSSGNLVPCGYFVADPLMMMSGVISTAYGVPATGADDASLFLVVCSNGEVYLAKTPAFSPSAVTMEHSAELVLLAMWRLDFPPVDLLPCYIDNDVINIVVHSLDKDTKLYALDRRQSKNPKGSTIRPYFLMRDHESGGKCLAMLQNGKTMCSAGRDGRIVLRDTLPYQKKLTPIPPSKEKRKPIGEAEVWHFTDGGIASIAIAAEDKILCVGGRTGVSSAVLKVVLAASIGKHGTTGGSAWGELTWLFSNASGGHEKDRASRELSVTDDGGHATATSPMEVEGHRKDTKKQIDRLRSEWTEQMKLLDDVGVAVGDLLLEKDRERFHDTCAEAIFEMREDEYYGQLKNQYIQDIIKEKCCETMDVQRVKVASVVAPNVEVHNFHIAKQRRPRVRVARKLAFLRSLQARVSAATGEPVPLLETKHGFSFELHHKSLRSDVKADESTCVDGEATLTLTSVLYPSCDVYTCGRACLQSGLLRGVVLTLKEAFNQEFTLLRQKKQSTLALIDERTQRCIQILKQLGVITKGNTEANKAALDALFAVRVDAEEDPNTLFTVDDSELDPAVRALIPQKQAAVVYSPENEAALKLWMDGLEKDVELVQVTLPVPEFADESKEGFVPLDERTDEQARLYEEYEKKLKEETEAVEVRKDALRTELSKLQKLNRTSAQELDDGLMRLRSRRIATAERIDETELQIIQLAHQFLKLEDAYRTYRTLESTKESFLKQAQHLGVALEMQRHAVSAIITAIGSAEEEVQQYAEEIPEMPPFLDEVHGEKLLRRFGRWKRKFDDGKGDIPNADKPPEDCPAELWEDFCAHCECLMELRSKAAAAVERHQAEEEKLQKMEEDRLALLHRSEDTSGDQQRVAGDLLPALIDTFALYSVRQGQIQDEAAEITSDFRSSRLRWTADVAQYNDLVLASSGESGHLREKIVKRRHRMKDLAFETKRLQYCVGTLRLELRQLHTLRVTRLMQEWLAGDADVSEDKAIAKIEEHISYVNENMSRKVGELAKMTVRIRAQLSERAAENSIVSREVEGLRSTVHDATAIQQLVRADGSGQYIQRARDIYQTSELEELARSQQEELIRLKRSVDALREKTFPSFAVVSKQRM